MGEQRERRTRDAQGDRARRSVTRVEQQRTRKGADEGLYRVPCTVEIRDLVDDELDHEQRAGDRCSEIHERPMTPSRRVQSCLRVA